MKRLITNITASCLIAISALTVFAVTFIVQPVQAATQTVEVYPNYDTSLGTWTERSGGTENWGRVHKPTASRADASWFCSSGGAASTSIYGAGAAVDPSGTPLPMPNIQQGVTTINASASGRVAYHFFFTPNGGNVTVGLSMRVNGAQVGNSHSAGWGNAPALGSGGCGGTYNTGNTFQTVPATLPGTALFTATAGNELTQQQINTLEFALSRSGATARAARINAMNAQLTYVTYSTLTQNGYRFYQNANSTTPGTAYGASASTPIDINKDTSSSLFRLRMSVQTTSERWLRQFGSYKLQYATKGTGSCSSPTGSWLDVQSGSGAIRWNNNASPADGATIMSAVGDPAPGTMSYQRYVESNPFSKQTEVALNNYGIWDFSLQYVGSDYGTTYCFRIANNDAGTQALNNFTNYPELRIVGNLGLDIVNGLGVSVTDPKVIFPSLYSLGSCQQNIGQLGTSLERIRVSDNRASGNWSLSIGATGGGAARWTSLPAPYSYAFNDSAGSPAGCTNGQLSLGFSGINAAPKSGCSTAGLSSMSDAAFTGGGQITIGGGSGADRFCYWDIMGIDVRQQIPAQTPAGTYSIDMTITVMPQ